MWMASIEGGSSLFSQTVTHLVLDRLLVPTESRGLPLYPPEYGTMLMNGKLVLYLICLVQFR